MADKSSDDTNRDVDGGVAASDSSNREVEEEDFKNRLERLLSRNNEIAKMREANTKLLADMKIKVKKARSKLSE